MYNDCKKDTFCGSIIIKNTKVHVHTKINSKSIQITIFDQLHKEALKPSSHSINMIHYFLLDGKHSYNTRD